jgi:hypothetical protein
MSTSPQYTLQSHDVYPLTINTLAPLPLRRPGAIASRDLLRGLVFAAASRLSVHQACDQLAHAPSGPPVLSILASQFSALDALEDHLNALLAQLILKGLGTRGRRVAVELVKLPKQLRAIASPLRKRLRTQFHTLWYRARQRKGLRVLALGQRLRRFAAHVTPTAGEANGHDVRQWFQAKKAGWYAVLADPHMPVTSTLFDRAHNAIDRNLFMMKGFHHPGGSHPAFLTGLAHLYNFIPYQRRAQHAGQCGVEVEGGGVPTADWFLNLQIRTAGGCRYAMTRSTT